jgi:selenocysteine-specific elongation factor
VINVVATAGHVDHGKSTLVRALTGIEPDRWAEERRRGMTIDLGFAWTTLPDGSQLAFVDVPGHERFVPNMLAGVGPVPAVVFVVAADGGWRPQSAEHLAIVDALGIGRGLLVVTRTDLADPQLALTEAARHIRRSSLTGAESVAVSAVTGAGIDDLRAALSRLVSKLPAADATARMRLWVDRVFSVKGAGTVVTGTLGDGRLTVGDELVVGASGRPVRVRGLQSCRREVTEATGVARVAVNLRGTGTDDLKRGETLVRSGEWFVTDVADVRLLGEAQIADSAHLMLHMGSSAEPARLRRFPGTAAVGRIRLTRPLPLSLGDRGLLRDPSRHDLVLGVEILDPCPQAWRGREARVRRGHVLALVKGPVSAADELRRRGFASRTTLRRLGLDVSSLTPLTGEWYVDEVHRRSLSRALRAEVTAHRAHHPLDHGLTLKELRTALALPDLALVRALVQPPLVVEAGRVIEQGVSPDLPESIAEAVRMVRQGLEAHPFAAPEAETLNLLGLGSRELAAAQRLGLLLRVADGVVLLPDAVDRAIRTLTGLGQPFTVSEVRQALGTTRRVAVPLLELLDRGGWTRLLSDGTRHLRLSGLAEREPLTLGRPPARD